ncbi:MAG: AI-2E family transporter [Alphaproteobacteria bacterium]|nr:AI-2E family transporter [Alphaproteobacteria bacterium]
MNAMPWRSVFWVVLLALAVLSLWRLSDILLPFVAGATIAYLLNPLAHRLVALRVPRGVTAIGLILLASLVLVVGIALLAPMIQSQVGQLLASLPQTSEGLARRVQDLLGWVETLDREYNLNLFEGRSAKDFVAQNLPGVISEQAARLVRVVAQVLTGSLALVNLLSLVFITPVVTFYLLRDWDDLVGRLDSWLPRQSVVTIRTQVREIDRTLAGYIRGQATLCCVLATYYAIGLGLVGLEFGLLIGVATGVLSFIPYVGALIGLVSSVGLAFLQFDTWLPIALVAAVFFTGQIMEGYVLQPVLVGDRVGLHPVWVIFALLAGGSLFGFLGLLLAIPVAAVAGVLIRFAIDRYLQSPLFDPRIGPP